MWLQLSVKARLILCVVGSALVGIALNILAIGLVITANGLPGMPFLSLVVVYAAYWPCWLLSVPPEHYFDPDSALLRALAINLAGWCGLGTVIGVVGSR